jgi:hypothetical protein
MPLAPILGIFALLAMPPSSGAPSRVPILLQAEPNPPAAEPPQPGAPEEQKKPAPESKQEPPPVQPAPDSSKPSEAPADTKSQPLEKKPSPAKPPVRPKIKKHSQKTKAQDSSTGTTKVVVPNGGATDPKIDLAPGLSQQRASEQQKETDRLLASTDSNLKKLSGRQLGPGQQATAKQVRTYMQQAKSAADKGDIQGAHNLAVKAHLLSEELAKR